MKILKKAAALLLSILYVCALCVEANGTEAENMFNNGDFSNKLKGWSHWSNNDSASKFEYDEADGCVLIQNTSAAASSLYQGAAMKAGESYMMTARVKYEDVSSDGEGVLLAIAAYDSGNNNIGEIKSLSRYGTSEEWSELMFIFTVPAGAVSVNGGPRLWFSTGKVWFDDVTLTHITASEAVSGEYSLTVSDTANKYTVDALGCEWDPKLLLSCNTDNGVTEDDLQFIKERMATLNIQAVRMMICPEWFEAEKDVYSFDNNEMKCVFAYLKVCQELGVRVNLTWWGAQTGASGWLSYKVSDWISAPADLDQMAENIVYLLSYVRNELKYSCVKGVILQNEPSYSYQTDKGLDFENYVLYYKTVKKALSDGGMSDITLIGSDDAENYGWYSRSVGALGEYCAAYDSHIYAWSADTLYLDKLVQEYVTARISVSDRPFFIGEFGDGSTVGAYAAGSTETYGRGLFVAAFAVNALKAGASGLSYWPLHDVYYYKGTSAADNAGLMSMGLIGYKTDGAWSYRPTYYSWGLLCNYIPYGSQIYDVTGDNGSVIDAVCAKTPEGKWSLVVVNRSGAEQTVKISSSLFSGELESCLFSEGSLPTDGQLPSVTGKAVSDGGVYTVVVPANSFKVLSDIYSTSAPSDTTGEDSAAPDTAGLDTDAPGNT